MSNKLHKSKIKGINYESFTSEYDYFGIWDENESIIIDNNGIDEFIDMLKKIQKKLERKNDGKENN